MQTHVEPIEYRNPKHAAVQARAMKLLRTRDAGLWSKCAVKILVAAPLLFAGPALIWLFCSWVVRGFELRVDLTLLYWGCFVVVVPWMFWYERRTHGTFFEDWTRGQSIEWGYAGMRTSSYGEYEINSYQATTALYVEIALWPARLILEAYADLVIRKRIGVVSFERGAQMMIELLAHDGGMPPAQLIRPGEPPEQIRRLFSWLMMLDVIDLGKNERSVWLRSEVRNHLNRA